MARIRFPVKVHCVYCDQEREGEVIWNGVENRFDTPGFFAFDDGICCEYCQNQMKNSQEEIV